MECEEWLGVSLAKQFHLVAGVGFNLALAYEQEAESFIHVNVDYFIHVSALNVDYSANPQLV